MIRKLCLAALVLLGSTGANADWALNMPKGVTTLSAETYAIHMMVFWWCVAIAVIVFGVMIYSLIRHRKAAGAVPAKFSHSMTAEIIWTTIPIVILLIMTVPSAELLIKLEFFSSLSRTSAAARRKGSGIDPETVDNYLLDVDRPLVVPKGAKVRFLLTSNDVVHAWWVPELSIKKDAIPGFMNETWFKAEVAGVYRGQCAELCGMDHGYMPIVVEVVEPEAYQAWLVNEKDRVAQVAVADGEIR